MTGQARAPDEGAVPQSAPAAAPRGMPMRWGIGLLAAVVLGLAVFVAWGESQGWPFLADPMQRRLAAAMQREVSLAPRDGEPAQARIYLLGGLRVDAPRIRIAAPEWSREPHLLLATEASFRFGWGDVLRVWRGGPLHIRSIRAEQLDMAVERLADGRASWQFRADPDAPARPAPTIGQLEVPDGAVRYRDVILDASVDAHFTLIDGSGRPAATPVTEQAASASEAASGARAPVVAGTARGLRVVANGKYRGFPLKAHLETNGVLPLTGEQAASIAVPVELDATIGRARLEFRGTATDAVHLGAMTGVFTLAGPSLAAVGDPLGITLPSTPAFRTEGRLVQRGKVWNAVFDSARIGSSKLSGAFTYDTGRAKPLLSGRLTGSRLLLADLGPAIGAPSPSSAASGAAAAPRSVKASGRVLPDREFDLPSLRVMDANVAIDIAEVDLGTQYLEPLRPLRAHLQLSDAVLRLTDIDARTGQGRLAGSVHLDGREKRAIWTTALRVSDVRLERWVKQARTDGGPPYVSGRLRGVANLRGEGRSTAQILGTLKGNVGLQLQEGKISHLAVEAAGIDIAESLGLLVAGDKPLDVLCGVADLQAQAGILRPRAFILDTTDSTVAIDGSVSMIDESIDLRAVVSPKDFSPMTLRSPVHVRGRLDAPQVSLETGPLARRLGAAALMALITPIAALLPLIDTGDPDGAAQAMAEGCRALVKRSGSTAAKAAPTPASAPAKAASRRP